MHVAFDAPAARKTIDAEILDLPSITPQALEWFSIIRCCNRTTAPRTRATTSREHRIDGHAASPIDVWAGPNDAMPAPLQAALLAGDHFISSIRTVRGKTR